MADGANFVQDMPRQGMRMVARMWAENFRADLGANGGRVWHVWHAKVMAARYAAYANTGDLLAASFREGGKQDL